MAKKMYFGTREYMTWVRSPAINSDISKSKWTTTGTYLNGGGYVRSSGTGHKVYQFAWNLAKSEYIRQVLDFESGIYGDGLIYFLDPFAVETNLLPIYWSAPRLGKDDAPTFVKDQRPTLIDTTPNSFGYPTKSAQYTLNGNSVTNELFIPVPLGHTFHLGVHGSSSGSARIDVTPTYFNQSDYVADPATAGLYKVPNNLIEGPEGLYSLSSQLVESPAGSGLYEFPAVPDAVGVSMLPVTTSTRTNLAITGASGVTIKASGTGVLTLAGLIAQIRPDGHDVPLGPFISGQGHSGVRFESTSLTGYSAPEALDLQGATATLRETGAWE